MSTRKIDLLVLGGIIVFSVVNGYFYHVYLGDVRDYGGYLANALLFASNKTFVYSLPYQLPAVGKALFTKMYTSSQPIGYSLYLSLWYSLFGLDGVFWANSLLMIYSLTVLYFLGRELVGRLLGFLIILFFATNYVTIYVSRLTLSENLMLPLLWTGVLLFILGFKRDNPSLISWSFVPIGLSLFVRVEGVLFLLSFTLVLIAILRLRRRKLMELLKSSKTPVFICLLILQWFLFYFFIFAPTNYAHLFLILRHVGAIITKLKSLVLSFGVFAIKTGGSNLSRLQIIKNTLSILGVYNILSFFLLGLVGLHRNVNRWLLLVAVLISPCLLYLYAPAIASDHPWMMRRFWPAFVPFSLISGSYFLHKLICSSRKLLGLALLIVLLGYNLFWSSKIFLIRGGRIQVGQIRGFAENFNKRDILVFPPEYWDYFGRFVTLLSYHYHLEAYWPLFFTKDGSPLPNGMILARRLKAVDKNIFYIAPKQCRDCFIDLSKLGVFFLRHTLEQKNDVRIDHEVLFEYKFKNVIPPTELRYKPYFYAVLEKARNAT